METLMDISRRACETMFREMQRVSEKIQLVSEKNSAIQKGIIIIFILLNNYTNNKSQHNIFKCWLAITQLSKFSQYRYY